MMFLLIVWIPKNHFLCSHSYYTLICTAEEYLPSVHQYFPSPQTWKTKSVVKAPCFSAPGIGPLGCTSTGHTVLIFFLFFSDTLRDSVSQTSLGSAINCFLWDMIRAPLPSVESHLMEGVVTLRPIRSHERLTARAPPSLPDPSRRVSIPRSAFLSR